MNDDKFPGFQSPKENWSKLPHQLIEALPNFTSQGELMVVLYILRHTWGFQEYDQLKKITIDEFMHGRKTKKGGRMDNGVGMSKGAVVRGLQRAEEHGFIETERDERDKARVKKYYMLKMTGEDILDVVSQNGTPKLSDVPKQDLDVPKQDTGVPKQDSNGPEVVHRSEKETLERNNGKEKEGKKTADPLSFDLDRQTFENNESNYAVPPPAGGADAFADGPVDAFCQVLAGMPPAMLPAKKRKAWAGKLRQVAEEWSIEDHVITADDMQRAIQRTPDSDIGWKTYKDPYKGNFAEDIGPLLLSVGVEEEQTESRRARDVEAMHESLATLDDRRSARAPPPKDDAVGRGVKTELEAQVERHLFRQHVAPCGFTCDDGTLRVAVPDEVTRCWLEGNLGEIVKRTLAGIADGPGEVVFEVGDRTKKKG